MAPGWWGGGEGGTRENTTLCGVEVVQCINKNIYTNFASHNLVKNGCVPASIRSIPAPPSSMDAEGSQYIFLSRRLRLEVRRPGSTIHTSPRDSLTSECTLTYRFNHKVCTGTAAGGRWC